MSEITSERWGRSQILMSSFFWESNFSWATLNWIRVSYVLFTIGAWGVEYVPKLWIKHRKLECLNHTDRILRRSANYSWCQKITVINNELYVRDKLLFSQPNSATQTANSMAFLLLERRTWSLGMSSVEFLTALPRMTREASCLSLLESVVTASETS